MNNYKSISRLYFFICQGGLNLKKGTTLIIVCMILLTNVIIMISDDHTLIASAHPNSQEEKIDYNFIYRVIQNLTNIILSSHGVDNGIYKGRNFGTAGEHYAAHFLNDTIHQNTNNLTANTVVEHIGNDYLSSNYDYKMHLANNNIEILGYGLAFRNATFGPPNATIPLNETFVFPSHSPFKGILEPDNVSTNDNYYKVAFDPWQTTQTFSNVTEYNISYNTFNASVNLVAGDITFIGDYDRSTNNQTAEKTHIINATDSTLNDTVNMLIQRNASGFILIRNNILNISSWSFNLPGIAVSLQNGSFLENLTKNGTVSVFPDENSEQNILHVFSYNYSTLQVIEDTIYLMNQSFLVDHYNVFTYRQYFTFPWIKGYIFFNSNFPSTHFQYPYSKITQSTSFSYSYYKNPAFSINGSILINGQMRNFEQWVKENKNTNHPVRAKFYINQRKNNQVTSYNVYSNIQGKDPSKYILLSGGHYEAWWGQMMADNAAGVGIMMGILKYFNDNKITPKYNLQFIFHGGHEEGGRGAISHTYNESVRSILQNTKYMINLDELIHHFHPSTLRINSTTLNLIPVLQQIAQDADYDDPSEQNYVTVGGEHAKKFGFVDAKAYYNSTINKITPPYNINISYIEFNKNNDTNYHQTGTNNTMGDTLDVMDKNDLNKTTEIIWNFTKYLCVNPNCWFSNVTFTPIDSSNDGDTLNDSIQINFTIHTILPNDKVRVKLFYNINGNPESLNHYYSTTDYIATSNGNQQTLTFSIPDDTIHGNFSIYLRLYNSTGRINDIIGMSETQYNDSSSTSNVTHLYHPLGYTKQGESYKCVQDNISGSVFTANEDGRADNITAFINQAYMPPGPYTCMLYQANDNTLIGTTTSDWISLPQSEPESSSWWAVFNFTGTKPLLVKGAQYVITCWGNSTYSSISYTDSNISGTGRYDHQSYGTPPDPADFTNEPRYYSLYCSYTPDATGPQITDVTANPDTVGFGYTVTITANVTDTGSSIDLVTVRISEPGGGQSNNTMTHVSGNLYQYVFPNTWRAGPYNYTIWAQDNETNSNTSDISQFQVTADATISIATLQDTYSGEEFINITDPPNPPENLTLVARGLTWDNYYNAITGENILEVTTGPINYQEDNDTWMPINTSMNQLTSDHPAYVYGYRTGNNHGLYGAYFKTNTQLEWPVAFTYNRSDDPTIYAVRSKLLGVGYADPKCNWSYHYLQSAQSSTGYITNNSINYEDVFTGTDVTWTYGYTGVKEHIILSNTTKTILTNHPPSQYGLQNESTYLVFITTLDHQNLRLSNTTGILPENVTISDSGVDFTDVLGRITCTLPLGDAYELHNQLVRHTLTYRIIHVNGNTYLLAGLKISDLITMTFPVVVDPTITVNTSTSDGFLHKIGSNYSTIWAAEQGTVSDEDEYISIGQNKIISDPNTYYEIDRGFLFFNTTTLPKNADIMNATLTVYKKNDYSSTNFMITIQNGQPSNPHDPLEENDYDKKYYIGDGGSLNTASFVNGTNNITLTNFSWITVGDITKFCLRSNRDINGTTPAGPEYITISSANLQGEPNPDPRPKLLITYRNQSKIKNTGSTDIKGYLLMQVQYYDTGQFPPHWIVDNDVVNETWPRTITNGNQLALDLIFNDMIRASDLTHGAGLYRVYAAFRDPEENILRTDDDVELVSWWEFTKT